MKLYVKQSRGNNSTIVCVRVVILMCFTLLLPAINKWEISWKNPKGSQGMEQSWNSEVVRKSISSKAHFSANIWSIKTPKKICAAGHPPTFSFIELILEEELSRNQVPIFSLQRAITSLTVTPKRFGYCQNRFGQLSTKFKHHWIRTVKKFTDGRMDGQTPKGLT